MSKSADPYVHRQREQQFIDHVERLLTDERLRVETIGGRRSVVSLRRDVKRDDREVELKRLMSELGVPDRELQSRMPIGRELSVTLSRSQLLIFRKVVGRLKVICLSPARALIEGSEARPTGLGELREALTDRAGSERFSQAPATVVALSTSGFTPEARELVQRRTDRSLILVEPNDSGGWTVWSRPEAKSVAELLDPERSMDKRRRIRDAIEESRAELLHSGMGAERIAAKTQLPLQMVEEELESYAEETAGFAAKRLEGNVVLFRDGSGARAALAVSGGADMPFMQRVRALFSKRGDNEKKIALLSERRATLSLQRDRAYEEMAVLEQREGEMRQQFKETDSGITKRRITSQLVQLRKDLERRHQLLAMLNQQINVVSTHLHNLELVQQGKVADLPSSEELASDAAAAEEVLAELQADSELAASIGTTAPMMGLSPEEQELYEELEKEAAQAEALLPETETMPGAEATAPEGRAEMPEREMVEPPPIPAAPERPRTEAEPG